MYRGSPTKFSQHLPAKVPENVKYTKGTTESSKARPTCCMRLSVKLFTEKLSNDHHNTESRRYAVSRAGNILTYVGNNECSVSILQSGYGTG